MNPIYLLGILSLLAGWHLDAIDHALIEHGRAKLETLNQSADTPPLIDTNGHGRYWIAQQ
jgi:hypothetical protein